MKHSSNSTQSVERKMKQSLRESVSNPQLTKSTTMISSKPKPIKQLPPPQQQKSYGEVAAAAKHSLEAATPADRGGKKVSQMTSSAFNVSAAYSHSNFAAVAAATTNHKIQPVTSSSSANINQRGGGKRVSTEGMINFNLHAAAATAAVDTRENISSNIRGETLTISTPTTTLYNNRNIDGNLSQPSPPTMQSKTDASPSCHKHPATTSG